MIIKKFQANTETEAITKARDELGREAVVMNVKTIKPRGIMKFFKPVTVEVTAALEEANIPRQEPVAIKPAPAPIADARKAEPAQAPVRENPVPDGKSLEKNIEKLQEILQAQMDEAKEKKGASADETTLEDKPRKEKNTGLQFIKILYSTLMENEVEERYVNQVMNELDNIMRSDMQIDNVLSNLYQKLILKFGKPEEITLREDVPKVVFFIGPTGVGKTTTVAKLASFFKIEKKKNVAFLTADTYRIAAADQLKMYADIMQAPLSIVYSADDMAMELDKLEGYDLILVDTAGYSHKNTDQQMEIKKLIESVPEDYDKQVFLVLSTTTKYADLKAIVDAYKSVTEFAMLFTKLDETSAFGNMLNLKLYCGAPLSYTTNGQNVPDDLEVFNSQRIVKLLLGGTA